MLASEEQYLSLGSPTTDFRTVIVEDTDNYYTENNLVGHPHQNRTLGGSSLVDQKRFSTVGHE